MTIFMLMGVMIFSLFIYVSMFSMTDFHFSWSDEFKIMIEVIILSFIAIKSEYFLGEGYRIPIILIGFFFIFFFRIKNLKKTLVFFLYFAILNMGLISVSMLLADVTQEFWWVSTAIPFTILFVGIFIQKILKKRIDMNIFNHPIFHLLILVSSIPLLFIFFIHVFGDMTIIIQLGNILFLITIAMMMIVIFRSFVKEQKIQNELTLAEASKIYIQELEEAYQALRTVRHDYINILSTLKLGIDQGNIQELSDYYYNELTELNKDLLNQDQLIGSLYSLRINEIKSILIYKCSAAASAGISTTFEIKDFVEKLGAPTAIICQILGILLDNAIEAASETETKKIEIAIIKNLSSTIFIIKNTWMNLDIGLNQLSELGFSTKGSGRGIGLHTVRNYTDKMEELFLETQVEDGYFTQILSIKEQ